MVRGGENSSLVLPTHSTSGAKEDFVVANSS